MAKQEVAGTLEGTLVAGSRFSSKAGKTVALEMGQEVWLPLLGRARKGAFEFPGH